MRRERLSEVCREKGWVVCFFFFFLPSIRALRSSAEVEVEGEGSVCSSRGEVRERVIDLCCLPLRARTAYSLTTSAKKRGPGGPVSVPGRAGSHDNGSVRWRPHGIDTATTLGLRSRHTIFLPQPNQLTAPPCWQAVALRHFSFPSNQRSPLFQSLQAAIALLPRLLLGCS